MFCAWRKTLNTCSDWDGKMRVTARKLEAPPGKSTHTMKPRSISISFLEETVKQDTSLQGLSEETEELSHSS